MQVQVHQVDTEVTWPHLSHQCVHVGAVHVEQPALGMQNVGNLVDLLLEHAQRIWVGEHERSHVFIHLRFKRRHLNHTPRVGFQILDCIADHRGCCRICAVRRIWNQNLLARRIPGFVMCAHHQQAGKLPMRACRRLQGDRVHAGDLDQALAERFHDAQRALRCPLRLIRMAVRNSFQTRDHFVHSRVVLHGARTQGIHAQIYGVVPGGESREVADDFDLTHFRHVAEVFAFRSTKQVAGVNFWDVERRQLPGGFAGGRLFKDQPLVLIHMASGFADLSRHKLLNPELLNAGS